VIRSATASEGAYTVTRAPTRPGLQAFPADEAAVWRFNVTRPPVPLVAVYPAEGAIRLDYPRGPLCR
jgi:hypothetical protein